MSAIVVAAIVTLVALVLALGGSQFARRIILVIGSLIMAVLLAVWFFSRQT